MHNLNCVYQNIDVRLCPRSFSVAVNAHILNFVAANQWVVCTSQNAFISNRLFYYRSLLPFCPVLICSALFCPAISCLVLPFFFAFLLFLICHLTFVCCHCERFCSNFNIFYFFFLMPINSLNFSHLHSSLSSFGEMCCVI